jgi:hypothetical protein
MMGRREANTRLAIKESENRGACSRLGQLAENKDLSNF